MVGLAEYYQNQDKINFEKGQALRQVLRQDEQIGLQRSAQDQRARQLDLQEQGLGLRATQGQQNIDLRRSELNERLQDRHVKGIGQLSGMLGTLATLKDPQQRDSMRSMIRSNPLYQAYNQDGGLTKILDDDELLESSLPYFASMSSVSGAFAPALKKLQRIEMDLEEIEKRRKLKEQELEFEPKITEQKEQIKSDIKADQPLPSAIQDKMMSQESDIRLLHGLSADVTSAINAINEGSLDFGLVMNAKNRLKNNLSLSDEQSSNLQRFDTFVQKMVNDNLRLNAGVQTDGDAVRERIATVQNSNDPNIVMDALKDLQKDFQRDEIGNLGIYKRFRKENRRPMLSKDELFGGVKGIFDVKSVNAPQPTQVQQPTQQDFGGFKIIRRVK